MSVFVISPASPAHQPFQCGVCHSRFTRNENLKRHAARHVPSQNETCLPCDFCPATFSRSDLRHRHMKRKHPEQEERQPKRRRRHDSVPSTQNSDAGSSRDKTSSASPRGNRHGLVFQQPDGQWGLGTATEDWHTTCRSEQHQQLDHARGMDFSISAHTDVGEDGTDINASSLMQAPSMSESTYVGHLVPEAVDLDQNLLSQRSLFEPTNHFGIQRRSVTSPQSTTSDANSVTANFNHHTPDSLLSKSPPHFEEDWLPSASQITHGVHLYFTHVSHFVPFLHRPTFDASQTPRHLVFSMLCLAYQHGEDPDSAFGGPGVALSVRCFHQARLLLAFEEERPDDRTHNITMIQAYLLLQICAMMYLCGKDAVYGLQMHSKMIFLARLGGLMQPAPVEHAINPGLESLWQQFITSESQKRTLFAVHQIDALWYQFLSVPRSLSHLEIKHELPCPEDCWTASSATEWAYRQLLTRRPTPLIQYADAVRHFLSPDPDVKSLPPFDPYGAINIAQFLISSARETTGWSTMTGRLSIERFEPIKSSLVALHPFVSSPSGAAPSPHSALCEATWEMAMIELQIWSPSHTGGIVEGSVDAVLKQSTSLAPSCEFLVRTNTAEALQPHVDWFLRYLEDTLIPDSEPPWIALYAYKAFLIARQLVRIGVSGAMQVVGVHQGDMDGAIKWARKVFQRRQQRQLGKLMMSCLDLLDI